MNKVKIGTIVCLGVLGAMVPKANADQWNQKTVFTFNTPVEIPGTILQPGTYVFKLLDSQSERNVVQVFNERENHIFGTFIAVANYRLKPTGKSILSFQERPAGSPEAVRAWFYPGDNYGHQFVYPKSRAVELAKVNNQPVASMQADVDTPAMPQTPLKAQMATGDEVEMSAAFPPASDQSSQSAEPAPAASTETADAARSTDTAQSTDAAQSASTQAPASTEAQTPMPAHLPQTGSSLPLIAMLGVFSLASGGLLKLASARK